MSQTGDTRLEERRQDGPIRSEDFPLVKLKLAEFGRLAYPSEQERADSLQTDPSILEESLDAFHGHYFPFAIIGILLEECFKRFDHGYYGYSIRLRGIGGASRSFSLLCGGFLRAVDATPGGQGPRTNHGNARKHRSQWKIQPWAWWRALDGEQPTAPRGRQVSFAALQWFA